MSIKKYATIIKNMGYLGVVQILNMLTPLLIYPHLMESLGSEKIGTLVYHQTIVLFFVIVVSFGQNILGVKEGTSKDEVFILKLAKSIFLVKGVMFLITLSSFVMISLLFDSIKLSLLFLYSGILIFELFIPIWYFQLKETMKKIAILNLAVKTIFFIMVLMLVRQSSDYYLVAKIDFFSYMMSVMLGWGLFIKSINFDVFVKVKVSKKQVFTSFKSGLEIFIGQVSREIYLRSIPIVLGNYSSYSSVAYFDFSSKVLSAYKSLISIYSQAIFPKMAKEKSFDKVVSFSLLGGAVILFIYILQILVSEFAVEFFFGDKLDEVVIVLNILTFSAFFVLLNNMISIQYMVPIGMTKEYRNALTESLVVFFVSIGVLISTMNIDPVSMAALIVLTEIYLFFSFIFKSKVIKKCINKDLRR
ncbi:oligosaccharide flippase family protein [Vibrio campbellii]|uniref:oligosaccharide flippase family protein n=1 Tax=Vibrio campbellii TaxID=680 RepID=UPI0003A3C212|nr:oligosaccharide flippase family protein [Vibrio campbellii]